MFDTAGFVVAVAVVWLAIGVVLSLVMGRRGHNAFAWLVLGALLGPLALFLAVDATRNDERVQPVVLLDAVPPTAGTGPVDVLVGYDGSPEAEAAVDAVAELFGDRLGRLTAATVVPFGDVTESRRRAEESLRRLALRPDGRVPGVELVQGHPSSALLRLAADGGYDVIAVGTRGAGFSKALVGSAASELARDATVPVLLIGGSRRSRPAAGDVSVPARAREG
ncbi:MAG TPA: universal stress protein [Acidimicrobiales bacterium]|nr:universal stress protein [Acidimicrobiales bacterium]